MSLSKLHHFSNINKQPLPPPTSMWQPFCLYSLISFPRSLSAGLLEMYDQLKWKYQQEET